MPFTPSHAIVALAVVRTPLVPAAVAVGAMTPDLPLFTGGLPLRYTLTHDPRWLPVTVVIALALLLVWRTVLRPAARALTPRRVAERLPERWEAGARDALRETFRGGARAHALLVSSLALGVMTHIVWDLFTHAGRLGVRMFPGLARAWGHQPAYGWLQEVSSAAGLVGLAVAGAVWLGRRAPVPVRAPVPRAVRWLWWASLPAVLVAAWVIGLSVHGPIRSGFGVEHLAYRILPGACALWGLASAVLAVAVCWMARPAAPAS